MFDSNLNIGIFSGVVVVILVILIFEYRNKFKKPTLTSRTIGFIKYLMLVIPLKPLITFIGYPYYPTIRKKGTLIYYDAKSDISEPIGYHLDNIFEYEPITFLYAFILILILYLFIEGKNFTSNSRIKNLKKLLNQGVLTQEEFDKKLQEIKEEEIKKV